MSTDKKTTLRTRFAANAVTAPGHISEPSATHPVAVPLKTQHLILMSDTASSLVPLAAGSLSSYDTSAVPHSPRSQAWTASHTPSRRTATLSAVHPPPSLPSPPSPPPRSCTSPPAA